MSVTNGEKNREQGAGSSSVRQSRTEGKRTGCAARSPRREAGRGVREQRNSPQSANAGQLTNDQLRVLRRAISLYGHTRQALKAIEEMGELTQALSKVISPRIYRAAGEPAGVPDLEHLYEEIADVEIMLKQLRLMTGADADVDAWIDRKIERLEARMREETRP